MSFTRTSIIRGPATVQYGSTRFYANDDIRVTVGHEIFEIINSAFGRADERSQQRTVTVEFTPVGIPFDDFWLFGSKKSGERLLGDDDVDLIVHAQSGIRYTFYNAGITRIPDLILSTNKTLCGGIQFTALGKGRPTLEEQDTANSLFIQETGIAFTHDFDPADVITETYSAAWGSKPAPWDDIRTLDGWTCSFDLNLQPVTIDSHGLIDWTIGNVTAVARCTPLGINDTDVLDQSGTPILGMHVLRGASISVGEDLVITGATPHVTATIKNALLRIVPLQYGLTANRTAQIEFSGVRRIVSSAVTDMFEVNVA